MGDIASAALAAGQPNPPSIKRSDPMGWLCASACAGAALGLLALVALWRPFPGLPAPVGSLSEHLLAWAQCAARLALPKLFGGAAENYAAFWAGLERAEKAAIIWRCAASLSAALVPGALLWSTYWTPKDGLIHLRGSKRHGRAESPGLLRAKFKASCKRRPDHAIAPGVPWPADM